MKIIFLSLLFVVISCKKSNENQKLLPASNEVASSNPKSKKFEMYSMSQLSSLMEKMYADQKQIKKAIIAGKDLGEYNAYIEKIKTAKMTDKSDNDAFYQEMATRFIASQKLLFETKNEKEQLFNKGIDACIQCHQQKCLGPISRIKKLYIAP